MEHFASLTSQKYLIPALAAVKNTYLIYDREKLRREPEKLIVKSNKI
jgi:hypothetical protein